MAAMMRHDTQTVYFSLFNWRTRLTKAVLKELSLKRFCSRCLDNVFMVSIINTGTIREKA